MSTFQIVILPALVVLLVYFVQERRTREKLARALSELDRKQLEWLRQRELQLRTMCVILPKADIFADMLRETRDAIADIKKRAAP